MPELRLRTSTEDNSAQNPFEFLTMWGFAVETHHRWQMQRAHGPSHETAVFDAKTASVLEMWERGRSK